MTGRLVRVGVAGVVIAVSVILAPSAPAAPPLDRLISTTIQSELIGYYREAFARAPDLSGYNYFVNLAAGNCYNKLGGSGQVLFTAAEFKSRPLTNSQRVKALYFGLLNRAADSSGATYWTGRLNAGVSIDSVVASFVGFAEYTNRVNYICYVHYGSNNTLFIHEANGLLALPFFDNQEEFVRQRELRRNVVDPYDWSTDGCSGPTVDALLLFDYRVCWRHDWGWRNYGRGLTMERTEARRQIIDDTFLNDMYESCERRWGSGLTWDLCMVDANAAYTGVRAVGW